MLVVRRAPVLEIEAKFSVPDEQTLTRLLEAPSLAGYALGPVVQSELHDSYLDTLDGAFLAGGYALRLRRDGERVLATLKGLGKAKGAIHFRKEHEIELPDMLPPAQWAAGPARDMAVLLAGDTAPVLLFRIDQRRLTRQVRDGDRLVAELSGDRVEVKSSSGDVAWAHVVSRETHGTPTCDPAPLTPSSDDIGSVRDKYLELEIELLPSGTERDLEYISAELEKTWRLAPVSKSKFQRALDTLSVHRAPRLTVMESAPHLAEPERAYLTRLALERPVVSRRARLVLAWDEGSSIAGMQARSGLSARRARYWRRAFCEHRMGIFPQAMEFAPCPEGPRSDSSLGTLDSSRPAPPLEPSRPLAHPVESPGLQKRVALHASDQMSDAGRKVLGFHFRRMILNEPGTRKGQDIEALHDMRVATRRMRAAFRIFGDYYQPRVIAPFLKTLRRTGRALGAVRDLDVFAERTQAYLETVPEPQRGGLDAFMMELRSQRDSARGRLLTHLDSAAYGSFVAGFAEFVEPRGSSASALRQLEGIPEPCLVRHVAPVAIIERFAAVRAYEGWVEAPNTPLDRYHALRIAAKRLRYALEFFSEVLGPPSQNLISQSVTLQDQLGTLQDAVVASGILRDFLVWGTWGGVPDGKKLRRSPVQLISPGVALYLAARQSEIQALVAGFPAVWATITAQEFARDLATAVGTL